MSYLFFRSYEQSHFTVALTGKTGFWWIGLRAHGTGGGVDYVWDNGLPLTFTHWDKDQPGTDRTLTLISAVQDGIYIKMSFLSLDSGEGTCVAMTTGLIGGFWDDKQCLDNNAFICEKPRPDITPPTKAPTPPDAHGCYESWTALPHFRNCYRVNKAPTTMTARAILCIVYFPVLIHRPIYCSSSTMWTGP